MASDCTAKHGQHDTLSIDLHLLGKHPGLLPDSAGITKRLEQKLHFTVFNWRLYANTHGYCPADDSVSNAIYTQGVWEAFETALFLDILDKGNKQNLVLDFGANIGWYTVLAAKNGYPVFAFECDSDIHEVLQKNIHDNESENTGKIVVFETKVGEDTEPISISPYYEVEFLKADVEGAEEHVLKMTEELFKNKQVKYAMFEISPTFNNSYPELVQKIQSFGYRVYLTARKGCTYLAEYEEQPLETLKKYCEIQTADWFEYLKGIRQEDFVFIRDDLV